MNYEYTHTHTHKRKRAYVREISTRQVPYWLPAVEQAVSAPYLYMFPELNNLSQISAIFFTASVIT